MSKPIRKSTKEIQMQIEMERRFFSVNEANQNEFEWLLYLLGVRDEKKKKEIKSVTFEVVPGSVEVVE